MKRYIPIVAPGAQVGPGGPEHIGPFDPYEEAGHASGTPARGDDIPDHGVYGIREPQNVDGSIARLDT